MSIIHDALKKTQSDLANQNDKTPNKENAIVNKNKNEIKTKNKNKTIIILVVFILLVTSVGIGYFFTANKNMFKKTFRKSKPKIVKPKLKTNTSPNPQQPLAIDENITLNGIMITGNQHVALIGEEIFEVGEKLQGLTISKITDNAVFLEDANGNTTSLSVKHR